MARVFVSHSSRDGEAAARLKVWLVAQGFEAPFLDFDKHTGIPPGADWERTLYRELSTSEAMLIVQTPSWLESKWCFAEFTQARALGKPIFPVIEAPTGETLIAPDIQALDLRHDRDGGLAQLARELTRIALDAQGGFVWDARRPPFPGLLAFEAEDAAVYFGRDDDIRRLIERLNARRAQGGAKLLALLGASGSGKSSLLRAGVLPRLGRDRRGWVLAPPFRPQLHPLDELARVMALARGRPADWRTLRDVLLADDPVRVFDDWAQDVRLAAGAHDGQVLLAVDQAEELYGTADRDEATRFEAILGAALAAPLPLMAVLALRSDFLEALQRSEPLGGKFEEFSLGPLPLPRVPQIIEGPARIAGLKVDDELVLEATRDAATEDALPLLAFALRELHDRYGQDGRLTIDDYRALGDPVASLSPLENSVRKAADDVLADARPGEDELRALKDAFVPPLVRVNDAGEYVRRPAIWTDLPAAAHDLLERLVRARLLVRRQQGKASVVEVTHEALLRKWPRLRAWLDEERTFLIARQQLEQDLRDWQQAPPGEKFKALLTGLKLARAESWLVQRPQQLTDDERRFVQASVEQARAEARRRARTRWLITSSSLAAAIVLAILAAYAWQQSGQALAERARALDLARVALATEWQERDASKAALILTELDNPDTPLATRKLGEMLRLPLVRSELPHDAPATFVAFSPGGGRIVTVAEDRTVRIWDTATGAALTVPLIHEDVVTAAAVSPNDAALLTVAGNAVRVWDIASGVARQTWSFGGPVLAAGFLAGGERVAIAFRTEVWVRYIETGAPLFNQPWRHAAEVTHLAVAPGQDRVATATADGRIGVWDAVSGASVDVGAPLSLQDIRQLAWGPSGTVLLAVSWSGIVLWDAATGERWSSDEGADSAWFGPNGRRFVTPGRDGGLLYTPATGGELKGEPVPQGHGQLLAAAFRRAGADILTLSGTGFRDIGLDRYSIYGVPRAPTVLTLSRRESGETSDSRTLTLGGHLIAAAFAPDGGLLATLSGTPRESGHYEELEPDTTVRLWNVEIGGERSARTLPGSEPALSPDGELVLTIDGTVVHLRRTADDSPHPPDSLRYEARVISAAFSPDGATLGVLTDDGTIYLRSLSVAVDSADRAIKAPSAGAVGFNTDGRLLWAKGGYGIVGVWEAATGASVLPTAPADCSEASQSRLDPAGRVLLRFCRDRTYAWTRQDDRFDGPSSWPPGGGPYVFDRSSTTGLIAIAVGDAVELRDANTGETRQPIELEADARKLAFAPDGNAIAAADDSGALSIVDPGTGDVRLRWQVGDVARLAFAHGRLVTAHEVFGQDSILKVWQVDDGGLRSTIPMAGDVYWNWTLDAMGQTLITWSDRSTRLWSLDTGEELFTASFDHPPSSSEVYTAAVTPDGAYLVTATKYETRVWAIAGRLLRQTLRATVGGCLSPAFRETVLGEPADEARSAHEHCLMKIGAAPGG